MKLKDKTVIVTGGASGIGAALVNRFSTEGAQVVVADVNKSDATELAKSIGGTAYTCDVTCEAQVNELVEFTESELGSVDMFCSNAGICFGQPSHAASASNEHWNHCWNVHVMAHVYAARAVLPGMIERGEGYLLQMASAAGLLNQIGDAAYSATKHAAVGFAESLAISHADDGVKVSVICPQYVSTPMLGYGDDEESDASGVITSQSVADSVVRGIDEEIFLILPHPQVSKFIQLKSADYDKWLQGMRTLQHRVVKEAGSTNIADMHKWV